MDWFRNDALFFEQLGIGHAHAEYVARRLREYGLEVDVTPMEIRTDIDDRHRFKDEHDLTVGTRNRCRIDVKSRDLRFTGVHDYRYATAFVDTVSGWDAKVTPPKAIVLISQVTRAMLVVSVKDRDCWVAKERFDRKRRIDDAYHMVATSRLRPFEALVAYLLEREVGPSGGEPGNVRLRP